MNNKSLLTVEQVAEYLQLKPKTIYNLVSIGVLPCYRINKKCVRFKKEEIDLWLQKYQQKGRTTRTPDIEEKLYDETENDRNNLH